MILGAALQWGHRMHGDFILIGEGPEARVVSRNYLGDVGGRDEAWLRDTILAHPQILPIAEIDETFGPLIPLCRELRTPAGPVDAVFINAQGRLTIVECKLWKNPQARREVVGQVLDYVSAITSWTYADLQRQVAAAVGRAGNVPFELANARAGGTLREPQFVDAVTRSLREGRLLALVVGDGIREEVQRLSETINRGATKAFSLGLVEVALYDVADRGHLLVQPRLLAKTELITRQIVIASASVQAGTTASIEEVDIAEPSQAQSRSSSGEGKQHLKEWWAPVLSMTFDDPEQEPPYWVGTNNVVMKTPFPGIFIKAFASVSARNMGVFVAGSRRDNVKAIEDEVRAETRALLRELPPGTEIWPERDGPIITVETEIEGDDARREWIVEVLNTYVNALRPRLRDWYAGSTR